ncbi:hypothetical protein MTO96_034237 [Rhipicephalus appendiculatus]
MSFDPERSSTNGNESPELEDVDSPWAAPSADKRKVEVVLVTGSSGFLGQHVVKLLQELDKNVKEIRLFDIKPYENKLKHSTEKPMKATVGDICNAKAVQEAFAGVDCVIHTAALVDCSIFPDAEAMEAVNVEGTRTVIDACIRQNVPYLVFTSTVGRGREQQPHLLRCGEHHLHAKALPHGSLCRDQAPCRAAGAPGQPARAGRR